MVRAGNPGQLHWRQPPCTQADDAAATTASTWRAQESDDFRKGLEELEDLIHEMGGGRILPARVSGTTVIVPMRARDDVLYFLRIEAPNYLTQPPSCTFV